MHVLKQLVINLWHRVLDGLNWLWSSNSSNDYIYVHQEQIQKVYVALKPLQRTIFSLGVNKVLSKEFLVAVVRVSGEAHAGSRSGTHVTEAHRLRILTI
jgi:hypothetical protein